MRISDPVKNPILSLTTCWFGGGGSRGPSKEEKQAAQQQQADMQAAAARQAQAQAAAQAEAKAQAAAQAEAQRKQMELMEKQRQETAAAQQFQVEEMRRQGAMGTPAPSAQIDAGNPKADMSNDVLRKKGLRKSILAGESNQAPMTTGYSTLG